MKQFLRIMSVVVLLSFSAIGGMDAGRQQSLVSVTSRCYAAEQSCLVWHPGLPNFNYIRCKNCGYQEDIGLLLIYRVVKAWYNKQNFSLSDITFDKNKLVDILSKATNMSMSKVSTFFFDYNKQDISFSDANAIKGWVDDNYKCSSCGAGDWEYVMIGK